MEDKKVIELPNGIVLYTNGFTETAQNWAVKHWGISEARVFKSVDAEKKESYLFVVGETPEYETQNYEQLSCHIDAYAMANDYKQLSGWASVL